MRISKRWNIATPQPGADALAAALRTSPLIAQILLNRGVSEPEAARAFLAPSLKQLHEPSLMPGLMRAAERIAVAIRERQKIVVYGDYDVDGITATAILYHAIRILGGEVDYYIPHRLDEGYGLNPDAMKQICDGGARLIVSVDCGVTAVKEAAVVAECGVELIITDHHEWKHDEAGQPALPQCYCIVHPRLNSDGAQCGPYPNLNLCGAGVAFKLAWGIGLAFSNATRVRDDFREFLIEATALAALGTIADVVPLTGENRVLAHFGLGGLKQSKLTGIRALIESAGLTGQKLDSYHVGFLLAPRLNACGRMGHAALAVEMLTRADAAKATEIAAYLEQQNQVRQGLERKIFDEAMAQVDSLGMNTPDTRAMVLGAEGWHPGVIGIVASRIVGRFNRPAIMVALVNGHGHGSGRSIAGFHLAKALDACKGHLETCGGHEMAAGLRLETARFADFRQAFVEYARTTVSDEMMVPQIYLDAVAELRHLNEAVVNDLNRLGPFGMANRRPLVCCKGLEVAAAPRAVGRNGAHLQVLFSQNGARMKGIAFNAAAWGEMLTHRAIVDIAAEPTINEYMGRRTVEVEVKDVRANG